VSLTTFNAFSADDLAATGDKNGNLGLDPVLDFVDSESGLPVSTIPGLGGPDAAQGL
jgi:hypothetical protein